MDVEQIGGNPTILILFVALIFFCSISAGLLYYYKSKCKDDECTNLVTYDNWTFDSENNNNIILKRKCNNNSSYFDGCKKVSENQTTKKIAMNQWSYASDDISGNVTFTRTCSNTTDCNLVPNSNKTLIVNNILTPWVGTLDKDVSGSAARTCTGSDKCSSITTFKQLSLDKLRKYPPILPVQVVNSDSQAAVSGAAYGNGTYTLTGSSFFNNSDFSKITFLTSETRNTNAMYHSDTNNIFNGSTGLPSTNAVTFVTTTGNSPSGNWVGIQLPVAITLKVYRIYPRSSHFDRRSPKEFIIYGSNDGTTWTKIDDRTGTKAAPNWTIDPQTFYIDNRIKYDRYRLHVTLVGNSNATSDRYCVNIEKWELYEEL